MRYIIYFTILLYIELESVQIYDGDSKYSSNKSTNNSLDNLPKQDTKHTE